MKFTAAAALAMAALANAQSLSEIPKCAQDCLSQAVKSNTKCSETDFTCICENFSAIQGSATGCVLQACGQDVALTQVLPATQKLCKEASSGGGSQSSAQSSAGASSAQSSSYPASASASSAASSASASGQSTHQATQSAQTTAATQSASCHSCQGSNGTSPTAPAVTAGAAAGAVPAGVLGFLAVGALLL